MTEQPIHDKARAYLETRIKTANREQLLIMLIDGAIRFSTQALKHMDENKLEDMNASLIRAQKIMLELIMSLDPGVGDDVYANLVSLYRFVHGRLVNANLKREKKPIEEALEILDRVRDMWLGAIEKMYKDGTKREELIPKNDGPTQGFVVDG